MPKLNRRSFFISIDVQFIWRELICILWTRTIHSLPFSTIYLISIQSVRYRLKAFSTKPFIFYRFFTFSSLNPYSFERLSQTVQQYVMLNKLISLISYSHVFFKSLRTKINLGRDRDFRKTFTSIDFLISLFYIRVTFDKLSRNNN